MARGALEPFPSRFVDGGDENSNQLSEEVGSFRFLVSSVYHPVDRRGTKQRKGENENRRGAVIVL